MAVANDNRRQEIINELIQFIRDKAPVGQADILESFAKRYYVSTSMSDFCERSLQDLFGALLSHWNFIYQRKPGEAKIRIFNPTLEKDGWQSRHTIIEISHDDIPFLVDSIRMEINRENFQIHFMIHFGGLKVKRDEQGCISTIIPQGENDPAASSEAPIYIEIDRQSDPALMEALRNNIERVLADVRVAVFDWSKMIVRAEESLQELEETPPPLNPAEIAESKDFIRWLINNNFTFLGSRDYKLIGDEHNRALQIIPGSGLGVLRDDKGSTISRRYAELPPQARKLALSKNILIIAKTNTKSTVHRMAYTDYIGVKRFNSKGELIGERRFVGLYTSSAYHSSPKYIPFLRHKVATILKELQFPPDSHNGKEALNILDTLPRDDLFQATQDDLLQLVMGILQLQERKRIRLFARKDIYGRYFSCLVYVPREIFNTELTLAMQDVLMQAFQGIESTFTTYFSDSVLARIHFLIRVNPMSSIEYNVVEIENALVSVARTWSDDLQSQLVYLFDESQGLKYYNKYKKAFPASYTEFYSPRTAIQDIEHIERLSADNPLEMLIYRPSDKESNALRFKLFHAEHTITLSDVLPILENMGLRIIGERPHELVFKDNPTVWINDFNMVYEKDKTIDVDSIKDIFQEAFAKIWFKQAENDGFNRLVLDAQLTWDEIVILRAYTKYLRQTGFNFSQTYIESALVNNSTITKNLIALFKLQFSPEYPDNKRPNTEYLIADIEKSFDDVSSLDEDRILRRILEVILATLRTNYFQHNKDGSKKDYLSFKLDPHAISDLPLPRPMFEIFVYSPRVEGVHLRGGKVARGGLRWSDRREDFRTEILGLMKAQQVKNSVIVPVGAKGGFYPKMLPEGDRDAIMKEVVASYSTFIRGLLDVTDNIKNGKVIPPKDVVRYDEDDTYLVVAADKGTATFSDIANAISKEYDFWLDDAFASGGSVGYDHKKMGITARGAWESVKRHFHEISIDTDKSDFTVVGIGDMSGDVFGNGMLLSKHIKLLAAYNHLHIFIDPNPSAAVSFGERKRLFQLPRSSWIDYDPKLISKGGGVFNRNAKSIKLTPEMKKAFDTKEESVTPNELIQIMLRAPVDLIWNGGIGTFVKSSQESHADVGDRANDGIRINGNEIQAKIVAEGGNLGLTQLGRIEYSLNGGVINTDFIDNSAGVDCSDHEVNIKILLNKIVADGDMTIPQRNKLLEKMTDEVAELVLRDNYEQTQMLSLENSVSTLTLDLFKRYMEELEKANRLNRKLEFLPDDKMIGERKASGRGLTRPELAVLLAYSKMYLKQDISNSHIPDDPYFTKYLTYAFPVALRKKYLPNMMKHPLKREIIATHLGKSISDHMGISFVDRLQRETGASVGFIVHAYAIAENIFQLEDLWHQIEALDSKITVETSQKMMLRLYVLIRRSTRWLLRNRKPDIQIEKTVDEFAPLIAELIKALPKVVTDSDKERLDNEVQEYVSQGVPESLAFSVASARILFTSLDIVEASLKSDISITDIARTYYALGSRLELDWLREKIADHPIDSLWDELARSGIRDDLDRVQRKLCVSVLAPHSKKLKNKTMEEHIERWMKEHHLLISRWETLISDIRSSTNLGFVTFSVVLRELFDYAHAS